MRRIDLENNNERYVAGREDTIDKREFARYHFAATNIEGNKILDIGCSSGYATKVMGITPDSDCNCSSIIEYVGVDYDSTIIEYAKEQFGDAGRFLQYDIRTPEFIEFLKKEQFDTIIAFEVIEHIDNGKEFAQFLKKFCKKLICSVPYKEPLGFWGEHHRLHELQESDFEGFTYSYMQPGGEILNTPNPASHFNLMLMVFDAAANYQEEETRLSSECVTIIIPHVDRTQELLFPCLKSIADNISEEVNVLIVLNGTHPDEIEKLNEFIKELGKYNPFFVSYAVIASEQPMGYTCAVNFGIRYDWNGYTLLLNNDTIIHDKDFINKLREPLKNKHCGITGAKKHMAHFGLGDFIIGFCMMIRSDIFDEIGLLDEQFNPGGMEDVDFSLRVQQAGYSIQAVNINMYHPGVSSTMNRALNGEWQTIFDANIDKLGAKYGKNNHVTAVICTRNRYDMLAQCVTSVLMQTERIQKLVIIDDSDNPQDLRNVPSFFRLLQFAGSLGTPWSIIHGYKMGQHISHNIGQDNADELVWRIDDDCIAEPTTLERLKYFMKVYPHCGAVGGRVITPYEIYPSPSLANGSISNIMASTNVQWYYDTPSQNVDHLHCTFLYRKGIANFRTDLSPVAHREETFFTYEIKCKGYDVYFTNETTTYHLRASSGGIRDGKQEMFEHDERLFITWLTEKNIILNKRPKIVWLNNGLGDHYAFLEILPELLAKHPDIIIAAAFPDVFSDFQVPIISIGEAMKIMTEDDRNNLDIYQWMWANNWDKHIIDAYRAIYIGANK